MEKHRFGIRILGLGLAMVLCPVLASCEAEIADSSFSSSSGYVPASGPSSDIYSKCEVASTDALVASFNVYAGARVGFEEDWETNPDFGNPGYGTWSIERCLADSEGNIFLDEPVNLLYDFPDFDKYPLTYITVEGWLDYGKAVLEWFFVDTFDFSTVDEDSGKIGYFIAYYDEETGEFMEEVFTGNYGVTSGNWFYYRIDGGEVTISETPFA